MKKLKYLSILMALAFSLIGGVYAYWIDDTSITGTATVGKMDMSITSAYAANLHNIPLITGGSTDVTDKSATLWVSNLYPTSSWNTQQNWQLIMKNTGSIPVKLGSVVFERVFGESDVWDQHKTWVHYVLHDENYDIVYTKNPGPIPFTKAAIEGQINSLMAGEIIPPGGYARYAIGYWFDKSLADNESQDSQLEFKLTFNWIQWNAP